MAAPPVSPLPGRFFPLTNLYRGRFAAYIKRTARAIFFLSSFETKRIFRGAARESHAFISLSSLPFHARTFDQFLRATRCSVAR